MGERAEGELNTPITVWRYTVSSINNGNIETEVYLTSDFTKDEFYVRFYSGSTEDEFYTKFYGEGSFWGLYDDKWRELSN